MRFEETKIKGVYVIEPKVFKDNRGEFFESFSRRLFEKEIGKMEFVQDNQSSSVKNVVRGFHFQSPPHAQAKLVRCVKGKVLDIAIDIREGSGTYGEYIAVELSEDNKKQLFIPRGFAHGFAVLSDSAIFQYKCDNYYCKESEGGISVVSEGLKIDWPLDISKAILSEKDKQYPDWDEFVTPFKK